MSCQQSDELVTCSGIYFDLSILLSHCLLVPVGAIAYHDSLHGDQTVGLFDFDKDVFIMLGSHLFSVAGPLS